MNGLIKKAGLGVALAATALTVSAPADAQRYRGYHGYRGSRGGDVATGALLGGIVGLGVGAAIAGTNRGRYYDRGYYYDAPPRVVYREPYYASPPRVVYREPYYAPPPRVIYRDRYQSRGYYQPHGYDDYGYRNYGY